MSKIRIPIVGTVGKSVLIDPNLSARMTALEARIAALGSAGTQQHRLLQGLQTGDDHPQYTTWAAPEVITASWNFGTPPDIAGAPLSEYIEDTVGAMVADSLTITWTYDDSLGSLTADIDAGITFLTADDQTTALPGSRRLLPGTSITFDDSVAGQRTINASGGGGGGGLVKLGSVTLGAPAATVTFSSISGSYTNLMLTFSANSATQFDTLYMQFNGDTGANYDTAQDFGGSGNGGAVTLSNAKPEIGSAPGSAFSASQRLAGRIFIPYYSDTSGYKESAIHTGRRDASALYSEEYIHNWHNTAAITQIVLGFVSGNNFVAGSRFDLYGMT